MTPNHTPSGCAISRTPAPWRKERERIIAACCSSLKCASNTTCQQANALCGAQHTHASRWRHPSASLPAAWPPAVTPDAGPPLIIPLADMPPFRHSDAPDSAADARPLRPLPCDMRSPASTSHAGRCGASAAPPAAPKCPSRSAQLLGGSGRATGHPSTAPCSACGPPHPAPTASALPLGPWGCAARQGMRRSAPAARCPDTPALTRLPAARPRHPL